MGFTGRWKLRKKAGIIAAAFACGADKIADLLKTYD